MYTDIFRFNLSNISSNSIIVIIISVLLQKCGILRVSIGIRYMNVRMMTIMFRLIMAVIPNSMILQGGVNIWYIFYIGLIYRFIRNWSSLKYYKITPSSPILIIPIIIIIEIVRIIIRPISLVLRIIINLTIGHIVIYILPFPLSIFYNLVEIFIYIIQIYIFWTLISIYRK